MSTRQLVHRLCALTAVCLALSGCLKDKQQETPLPPVQQPAAAAFDYAVHKIVSRKINDTIQVLGTVEAYQEVSITPEIPGKISRIHYGVGDVVSSGDVLAEIDDEARRIALRKKRALLKKAEASYAKAMKDQQKSSSLFQQGIISDSESDDTLLGRQIAEAELNLARAEVRDAEKQLRDTKITAPFDGRIAVKDVELGQFVSPGQSLFILVDVQRVKVVVNVSEMDIAGIVQGASVEVRLDSMGGALFTGTVAAIDLKADDVTRTFPVEIVIDNRAGRLLPGMVARVTIASARSRDVVIIPRAAVRTRNGEKVVFLVQNGGLVRTTVALGQPMADQVVVEAGLTAGDSLAVPKAGAMASPER